MEDVSEEREQRLGAIELEEGADSAEGDGRGGQRVGGGANRLGVGFQGSG